MDYKINIILISNMIWEHHLAYYLLGIYYDNWD